MLALPQTRLAELRARSALTSAGLDPDVLLVPLESVTNEVWASDDHIVRVNRRLHSRLRREADLVAHLPTEVRSARLVAVGEGGGGDWLVLEKVPGVPLVRCWPGLTRTERRRAVADVAAALRVLHATEVRPELAEAADAPQLLQVGPDATAPLVAALRRAGELPFVDPGLITEVEDFVRALRPALDPFESTTLIHGDLHFQNVLWDGDHVSALLDFEFARAAPADVDLDVFLRFCCHPHLFVPEGRESEARALDYDRVLHWMFHEYPELFEHPLLGDRLRVYAIAFDVKDLLASPPRGVLQTLTPHHPYQRLRATLRGESHLDRLGGG